MCFTLEVEHVWNSFWKAFGVSKDLSPVSIVSFVAFGVRNVPPPPAPYSAAFPVRHCRHVILSNNVYFWKSMYGMSCITSHLRFSLGACFIQSQVYFVHEMSLIVWKERVFESLKQRLRHNTIRVINAAREKNLSDLDDNDAVKSLLQT